MIPAQFIAAWRAYRAIRAHQAAGSNYALVDLNTGATVAFAGQPRLADHGYDQTAAEVFGWWET